MANTIKLKRGTSTPTTSNISSGEVAIDTSAQKLYINDSGTVKEIGGGGSGGGATGIDFNDDVKIRFGTGNDLEILHNGTNSYIKNSTGSLFIQGSTNIVLENTNGEDYVRAVANEAVELYYDNSKKFETTSTGNLFHTSLKGADNADILLGNSDDLQLFHDGSDSWIRDTGTGRLNIDGSQIQFRKYGSSEVMANFIADGSVELYDNGGKRFETTASGWKSEDNIKGVFGTGDDLQIYHDGTLNVIDASSGNLEIRHGAEKMIACANDGQVELYWDGAKKLETTSTGAKLTGNLHFDLGSGNDAYIYNSSAGGFVFQADENGYIFQTYASSAWNTRLTITDGGNVRVPDNGKFTAGASDDLQIYHDGTHNQLIASSGYIKVQATTNDLYLRGNTVWIESGDGNETFAKLIDNGAVELYYDNVKTFETTTHGARILATEGQNAELYFHADEGDDNDDKWKFVAFNSPTGTLDLYNYTSGSWEKNISFVGNGAVELYHDNAKKLNTDTNGISVTGRVFASGASDYGFLVDDDVKIGIGTGKDLQIYHDGSHTRLNNATGNFNVQTGAFVVTNVANSENLIIATQNGDVELYYDNSKKIETASGGINVVGYVNVQSGGHVYLEDSGKLMIGTSTDMQIYHTGGANFIETGSQIIHIQSDSSIRLQKNTGSENMLIASADGAVELYYDNTKRFETNQWGAKVTGSLWTDGIYLDDNEKIHVGSSGTDIQIYHDGSNSWMTNSTGWLIIGNGGSGVSLRPAENEDGVYALANGAVSLYYDNAKKLETQANGVTVTGGVYSDGLICGDSDKIELGTGGDLQIYHDGSSNYVDAHNGTLYIRGSSNVIAIQAVDGENTVRSAPNAEVKLYYDNSLKFQTTSAGCTLTGSLTGTGHVYLPDGGKFVSGAGDDLQIYHDSNTYNYVKGANIIVGEGNSTIFWRATHNENSINSHHNGSTEIYYDNSKKFNTNSGGIAVHGDISLGTDNYKIKFGTGEDLQIYHDGSNSYISDTGTGNLNVLSSSFVVKSPTSDNMLATTQNGSAELYYDSSKKLQTSSSGVTATGDFIPATNNTYDLGTSSARWKVIYTNDLSMSNKGGANSVDGTWGDWTLQEGEENLFVINNRSGKKYKMGLVEVN